MLHSFYGPKPVRFGQDWVVPGLRQDRFVVRGTTNVNKKLELLQKRSDERLMMMRGQPPPQTMEQKAAADKQQLLAALGKILEKQNKGPATPGSTLAKNLDFSKPFQ